MNTYDPADYILYVSMDRTIPPRVTSTAPAEHRLPTGYANESPGTRLRTRTSTQRFNSPRVGGRSAGAVA